MIEEEEDDFYDEFFGEEDDNHVTSVYDVRGFALSMDRKLNNEEIMFLSLISINGYKFYKKCIDYKMNIGADFMVGLSPIMKQIKRSETIKNVLEQ